MFFDINAQYFFNTQSGVLKNIQYPQDKQLLPKYIMTVPVNICIKYVLKYFPTLQLQVEKFQTHILNLK